MSAAHSFNAVRSSRKLVVLGMRWTTCHNTLKNYFKKYGVVEKTRVVIDLETGRSKGYGFVVMQSMTGAEKAMEAALHTLDGHQVELDYYRRNNPQADDQERMGDEISPQSDTAHNRTVMWSHIKPQIGADHKLNREMMRSEINSETKVAPKKNGIESMMNPLSDIDHQVARARGLKNFMSEIDNSAKMGGMGNPESDSIAKGQNTEPITAATNYAAIDFKLTHRKRKVSDDDGDSDDN